MQLPTFKITVLIFSIAFIYCCQTPTAYDHIEDLEARTVLEKGIAKAGGLDTWKNSTGYQFDKRSILYLEDGSIESKNTQVVRIADQPELEGTIIWANPADTVSTRIEYKNGDATKYVNDQAEEDTEAPRKSFLGSHLVMSLPFKLLDQGVDITYGGTMTQFDKQVEVLVATYDAEHSNHTASHIWWHYFDAESYEYVGYKVYHAPTYALVENLKTTTLNGITYPVDRITWRVDSLDNKQFIRAKFAYSGFEGLGE